MTNKNMSSYPHIYLIAGEASGDTIGSKLINSLKDHYGESITLSGIGGELMEKAGIISLFPMQELSLMGFVEIIPHVFSLKRRIKQTVSDIIAKQPDILITIDSPGFNNRVITKLKAQGFDAPIIHYVAPTVWAYKPKRAAKAAKLYDHLLTILPFEPPYFEKEGLKTTFVGHPYAWEWRTKGDGQAFRAKHAIANHTTAIGLMPGSRINEIIRHLPIFHDAIERLAHKKPHIIIPVREDMADFVLSQTANWPCHVHLAIGEDEKKDALDACTLALAKSGTISLECALAEVPTITAFDGNRISIWIAKRMVKIAYVNLINIMSNKLIIPEYIGNDCTSHNLARILNLYIEHPDKCADMVKAYQQVTNQLLIDQNTAPSTRAVEIIDSYLKKETS